ncbi:MAG: TRAP transporter substrate-binding protein [Verrucomicrobiota bacterium]
MDKKAVSFLILGGVIGALLATGMFSYLSRSAPGGGGATTVLKLAHALPEAAPVHKGMAFMAQRVAELSGGTVEIQIFPSAQLGSETETIEQLQRGAIAMVKTSTAAMEGFVPEMAVFGVPYLFADEAHFWRVLQSDIGEELLLQGLENNIRGLCYYDAGARSFYTTRRMVRTPADLRGMKIRTMPSPTAMDMIDMMGGSATPMPFGELYTGLQQGMVDGAENNPPSVFDSRHWEVAKHYSLDEHSRIPDMLIMSDAIWQLLPTHVQAWIEQAVAESVDYQREVWDAYVETSLNELAANGVDIYRPDKAPFQAAVAAMYEDFEGTAVGDLITRVEALR